MIIRPIYKIATAPAAEPVTKTEAKLFMRLATTEAEAAAYTAEDAILDAIIATARAMVEKLSGQSLISQTWDLYLQEWPAENFIEIAKPPLASVTHVKYTDSDATESTWSSSEYSVDIKRMPGRIVLNYGYDWPSFTPHPLNPINIRFVAGYGAAGSSVPANLIHALKLLIVHYYEQREDFSISGGSVAGISIPWGVQALIDIDYARGF